MTHLDEVKTWLAALELWRMARAPTMPCIPSAVATWLMDQAMELDDGEQGVATKSLTGRVP